MLPGSTTSFPFASAPDNGAIARTFAGGFLPKALIFFATSISMKPKIGYLSTVFNFAKSFDEIASFKSLAALNSSYPYMFLCPGSLAKLYKLSSRL